MRILCAMLLVFAGLAHRPMSASAFENPQSAAYVLPDGVLASLCITGSAEDDSGKHVDRGCEACRLASGAMLAERAGITGSPIRVEAGLVFFAAVERFHRLAYPPAAPPRGPPADLDFA